MSLHFNKALGLPVISQESGNRLGEIEDLVIDYETGKLLALLVSGGGVMAGLRIVRTENIRNISQEQVLVRDDASLEILGPSRIQDIIQSKIKIKSNKVITENGTNLGKAIDFELDLESERLSCISVRTKILGKPLVVSWDQIVSIGKEAIVVKEEVVKVKTLEPELARA